MDLQLKEKVAVVTGAGNGIGRGIALGLAAEGAFIVAADLNESNAGKLIREIAATGGKGVHLAVDATDERSVEEMVQKSLQQFGHIDILVNNAGGGSGVGPVVKLSATQWDRCIELNLRSVFLCSAATARVMIPRRSGRIINISSISGKVGESLIGPYSASKFGSIGLTQVMAKELARYGITVNAVCPGYVWTPGWEGMAEALRENFAVLAEKTTAQIFEARVNAAVPLGRPQTPEDVAVLVAFLASERAKNITGQAINVDGGAVMA